MKDIKNYLEKQVEISNELNEILVSLDKVEEAERQLIYSENERLLNELNSINNKNVNATRDRVALLRERVNMLLSKDDINKDPTFKKYLVNLNSELISLSIKINTLNETLIDKSNKHESYMNRLNEISNIQKEKPKTATSNTANKSNSTTNNLQNKTKDRTVDKKKDKFEFNIGSNILNILGVMLILMAFITFGKYIYTYYLNDMLKGVSLFVLSSIILILGEKVFFKKIPKFALGISALGIGALYASLIINYLILRTMNSIVAIIITLIITAISLFISSKHNSNIIRILGLIGGYGCLMPIKDLDIIQSYITITILLIISIANIYIPIENKNFSIYSSILNIVFCFIITSSSSLNESASLTYLTFTTIINNIVYIKLNKENYNKTQHLLSFITTFFVINKLMIEGDTLAGFIGLLVSLVSYYLSTDKLKSSFYCHGLYASMFILLNNFYEIGYLYIVAFSVLLGLTIFLLTKLKDMYMKVASIILTVMGLSDFIANVSYINSFVYLIVFSLIIWMSSKKYKNHILLVTLKHSLFGALLWKILLIEPFYHDEPLFTFTTSRFIAGALCIIYVLKLTHIERLKHNNFKNSNFVVLILSLIILNLTIGSSTLETLIALALSSIALILITKPKYVENNFTNKKDILIYSLFLTYAVCLLVFSLNISSGINNLILSISLMIIAFINVWLGFKLNLLEVRRYGLILSLLVCAKLILVDFYSYDFIIKTGLFLVVGIVALIISYIYTKLEQDLKNNKDLDDINNE